MTVLQTEGFDAYNGTGVSPGLQAKWVVVGAATSVSLVAGRFGGQALRVASTVNNVKMWCRPLPSAVSALAGGFAFRASSLPTGNGCTIAGWITSALTIWQNILQLNNDGSLTASRAGPSTASAPLGSSVAAVIVANTWHYIEYELVISDTVGVFKVWVDNVLVINLTNVDTRNGTPTTVEHVAYGNSVNNVSGSGNNDFDDHYATDGSRLGERRIETLRPAADTATKAFTPNSGTANFSRVNETLVDGDTSYVQGSTVGNRDLYTLGALSSTPSTIDAVNVVSFAEKTDATARTLYNSVQSAGTDSDGSAMALAASYTRLDRIIELDPNGGGAWTASRVNGLLVGPKIAS